MESKVIEDIDRKKEAKMIKKWLKKNKPSKRFKDEVMHKHITPESILGRGVSVVGEFI